MSISGNGMVFGDGPVYGHVERLSALFSPWYFWQSAGQTMILPGEPSAETGMGGTSYQSSASPAHGETAGASLSAAWLHGNWRGVSTGVLHMTEKLQWEPHYSVTSFKFAVSCHMIAHTASDPFLHHSLYENYINTEMWFTCKHVWGHFLKDVNVFSIIHVFSISLLL